MPTGEDGEVVAPAGMIFENDTVYDGADMDQAVAQKRVIPIWAEESSSIASNQNEYSFGNGATGFIGIPLLGDWELIGVTVNIEAASGALPTIAVMDFTATNNNTTLYQFTCTANPHVEKIAVPPAVTEGVVVGFRTVNDGGTNSDVRVCAWLEQ